ncbi:hypothetical protein AVEN_269829-1 [Araneus ventricosus]|uniref:Uncharacterized protein n=1 Tax=Araneus ventricosus TaxID=182803 RepID=A0A4Y2CF98_ARAVE|nr:hypothetical protein AVEN_269829-1 [Araneus ventricosus]
MQRHELIALERCSHNVILGWDFLKASQAIIDCGRAELLLEDTWTQSTLEDFQQSSICTVDNFDIPPLAAKKVRVTMPINYKKGNDNGSV